MKDALRITTCTAADIEDISEVAIRAYRDTYLYLWNDDGSWYINRSFLPVQIQKELMDPNAIYMSLWSHEEVMGFMKLNIDQPLTGYENLNALELERIYLLKSASGKGFGTQALEYCFDFARKRNKEIVWLKCMDSSSAIHFYKRMGFVECGESLLDFPLMKPEFRRIKTFMKKLTADSSTHAG